MKLRLDELIDGKYYQCYIDIRDKFYFKFKEYDDHDIIAYGFYIMEKEGVFKLNNNWIFCSMQYYKQCEVFKEIYISLIVDYLPDTNIDKKII